MALGKYIKLEMGAGEHPSTGGFEHNDIVPYPDIEIVADCRSLLMVESGSVTIIRAIHLLEHFRPDDAEDALREWVRLLCPGGVLEIAIPDMQKLALMAVLQNITLGAFLRDVYGLAKVPDLPPETIGACMLRLSKGFQDGYGWVFALQRMYGPIWAAEKEQPQAHRWGYCEDSLRLAMEAAGLEAVVVEKDGTSLHAWGERRGPGPG